MANKCVCGAKRSRSPARSWRQGWAFPPSAISNYENGLSSPKEDVLLKLFDALEVDPNYLFRGFFRAEHAAVSREERS